MPVSVCGATTALAMRESIIDAAFDVLLLSFVGY